MTTFRSDDEYWAWCEREARRREKLEKAARYVALLGAGALILFAIMYFAVRNIGETHYDRWHESLRSVRTPGG